MGTRDGWMKALDARQHRVRRLYSDSKAARFRRLDKAAPTDRPSAASMMTDIAKNTKITVDVNKLLDQLGGILKSSGGDEALIINMDTADHTFFCKPDVMNLGGLIKQENYCPSGK